jgi:hypothetical protein
MVETAVIMFLITLFFPYWFLGFRQDPLDEVPRKSPNLTITNGTLLGERNLKFDCCHKTPLSSIDSAKLGQLYRVCLDTGRKSAIIFRNISLNESILMNTGSYLESEEETHHTHIIPWEYIQTTPTRHLGPLDEWILKSECIEKIGKAEYTVDDTVVGNPWYMMLYRILCGISVLWFMSNIFLLFHPR